MAELSADSPLAEERETKGDPKQRQAGKSRVKQQGDERAGDHRAAAPDPGGGAGKWKAPSVRDLEVEGFDGEQTPAGAESQTENQWCERPVVLFPGNCGDGCA